MSANERWFEQGLLRHEGAMTPEMVADTVAALVSLPVGVQQEFVTLMPSAPVGPLPESHQAFVEGMARRFASS